MVRAMTVGARIRELRSQHDLTQEGFTARLNQGLPKAKHVTRGAVGNWERDQGIKRENLELISTVFSISFEWLATGRGEMSARTVVPVGQEFSPDPEFSIDPKTAVSTLKPYKGEAKGAIPDIDVSAGAGPGGLPLPASTAAGGALFSADAIRGEVILPPYILGEFTRAMAARVHMVRVRGDSMEPTLMAGDRVLVDTTDQAIGQGGAFVLLDPDGEVLVKRLRKRGNKVEVISDNPKQGSDIYPAEDVRIIGRVVARLSRV